MSVRLTTPEEIFSCKLGAALTMESDGLAMLDELQQESQREELRQLFDGHADETRQHIRNIAESFRLLGEKPEDHPCPVIHALEKDFSAAIERTDESIVDAMVLAAAIEVEHYEIAVYESLIANADVHCPPEVAALLRESLQQEQDALEQLRIAAQRISREGYAQVAVGYR
jgi:ferritin-like metal-binding protein YciE